MSYRAFSNSSSDQNNNPTKPIAGSSAPQRQEARSIPVEAQPPSPSSSAPMSPPVRRSFDWPIALLLLGAFGLLGYSEWRTYDQRQRKMKIAPTLEQMVEDVSRPRVGGPFDLVDTEGRRVTNENFKGKYALIYFGFTHCPDICPLEMKKMDRALRMLEAMPEIAQAGIVVYPIFISVDPKRDTPERMRAYAAESGYHPRTTWLVGTDQELRKVARSYRLYYSTPPQDKDDYQVDHSVFFYLLARDGGVIDFYGKIFDDKEVAERMRITILREEEKWNQTAQTGQPAVPVPQVAGAPPNSHPLSPSADPSAKSQSS